MAVKSSKPKSASKTTLQRKLPDVASKAEVASSTRAKPPRKADPVARSIKQTVDETLEWLDKMSTQRDRENLARFGITATNALGVSMANLQKIAKVLGHNHELAAALWETGCYEARMLTSFVDEPALVTATQMDRWCREFDNWAICDTLCFHLFDRTPHAWAKVSQWSEKRDEYGKRTAFALLACLSLHNKTAGDENFMKGLRLIEQGATDERNFVKKAVSWALRGVGRRNAALHAEALSLARRLTESPEPSARWVGRDALRDLTKPKVVARLRLPGKAKK